MKISIKYFLFAAFLGLSNASFTADIIVKGLFKNGAILVVDGQQHVYKVGKASKFGVELIEANSQKAIVLVNGKRTTLTLSDQIGANYAAPESKEVRIAATQGNHYVVKGLINNQSASMLVDTGATSVAMSSPRARSLGIDYKKGRPIRVSTANGIANAYIVNLRSVTVGSITINNVEAAITEGNFPREILLGNSFLSRLEYSVEQGVLILKQKFLVLIRYR